MSITVNILYTSTNGQARKFAEEMVERNIVKAIRAEEGNEKYDYYFPLEDTESLLLIDRWKDEEAIEKHHKSEMMAQINELRKKYKLKMKVERFTDLP
ncbi:TPA: antibiotic biosynthesis monooxygenase [Enterococcus faecium]|uniref:antibiotic biosynthesis monooxygenase family protein n=1 Tax=Enterococcus faecium TaxID=1352 RepID=UPI0002A3DFB1|nr:antibiotic biosynthesis monooxygenase [Enterococcus faecium]ELB21948.1 antibiotic biosynthesis monooxygenase [Enterococcus faecium EnGen0039]ELB58261.1 antibiotic biosynthesis monooxygenase [Enterococcus faecium EnGen0052]MBE5027212.1 antibiotic biosynthesis monooxygenase [Enterococcus faecium]MCB4532187.1 antibiotic biosynthesis monooxygenase [Enterococcus faecium]TNX28522.1 antibiotic biosynthesis monooxygenase [Enterococcus faecium]